MALPFDAQQRALGACDVVVDAKPNALYKPIIPRLKTLQYPSMALVLVFSPERPFPW
jgi:hypothetical protein